MWHVWRKGEVFTRFWWGNLRRKRPPGRTRRRWEDNIKCILRKWDGVVGTGWSWLRIGTSGGRL